MYKLCPPPPTFRSLHELTAPKFPVYPEVLKAGQNSLVRIGAGLTFTLKCFVEQSRYKEDVRQSVTISHEPFPRDTSRLAQASLEAMFAWAGMFLI